MRSKDIPLANLLERWRTTRPTAADASAPVAVICRRGNDSQVAVLQLRQLDVAAVDVVGGYEAWAAEVDPEFPIY